MKNIALLLSTSITLCLSVEVGAETTYVFRPPPMSMRVGVLSTALPDTPPDGGNGGFGFESHNWNSDLSAKATNYTNFTLLGQSAQSGSIRAPAYYQFPSSVVACDWYQDASRSGSGLITTGMAYLNNGVWSTQYKVGAPKAMSLLFRKAGSYRLVIECGSAIRSDGSHLSGAVQKVTFNIAP